MSRYVKEKIVAEYADRFGGVSDVAVVSAEGVDANRMVMLRRVLRERGIQAMRVQNRLARLAVGEGPLAGLETLFDGPTTLVWGGESIVDLAKVLADEAKAISQLEIRGGVSGGQVLSKQQIEDLSRLPSREELIGQVVARAIGQAGRVVALAMAGGGRLLAQIREIEKNGPANGEPTPAEEPAAEVPDEAERAEAPAEPVEKPAEPTDEPAEAEKAEKPADPPAGSADEAAKET